MTPSHPSRCGFRQCATVLALACAIGFGTAAQASPWAEPGDAQLRSDIEILAAAGAIDGITTQWPLPWASIVTRLRDRGIDYSPVVRAATERVLARAERELHFDAVSASVVVDATNAPSVVRGFDALGRQTVQGDASVEYMEATTALRLSIGSQTPGRGDRQSLVLDDSYVAQKIGGAVLYAGYLPHWWGPGWISALSLSTNARPMPQIGIARDETIAFENPLLSWLGPWQGEFFIGVLDGDNRIARNTIYSALRITLNPLPGLEIGLGRTTMMCGTRHDCVPLRDYFDFENDPAHVNHSNDEGVFDIHYSGMAAHQPYEFYVQLMNEDSNPFSHSVTSHLFGASIWIPTGANPIRITVEYADSVPTVDIFSFGDVLHGGAYNNVGYLDGMRYRERTLGFSLDSDSRLLSLQGNWLDDDGRSYTASFHHAAVSNPNNLAGNVVTSTPVIINMGELRAVIPFDHVKLELAGRLQDDQPRPDRGVEASIEAQLAFTL